MRAYRSRLVAILCFVLSLQCAVCFGADKKKATDKPPELTESDKKKLAEIEARPEVKATIEAEWRERRRQDLDYLYRVNSSAHFGNTSGPEYATFIQNYHQLYNNPMLQRYLNAIGQQLVPKNSPNTYAFKLVLDPSPSAQAFSTGTVLVSTGLVSMLDNQAQLAYVLGHEITHIEKKHQYDIIRMTVLERELNKEKEADASKKRALIGALVSAAGAGIGAAGGGNGAMLGAVAGFAGSTIATQFLVRDRRTYTEWSTVYEDEADASSLQYMLQQNYDARESPKLYARLQKETAKDPRIGLGFIADEDRMRARVARINSLLSGEMKGAIDAKISGGGLTGSSGDFNLIMAALKRDNGIVAIDYDLFDMARDNLEEAVALRGDDSLAQQSLGQVISITARDNNDRGEAEKHFLMAIQYDKERGAYPEPHLEHALHLIGEHGDKGEIRREVEAYVALYQRNNMGAVPGNVRTLYDYLTMSGEPNWYATPASVVSTRYVESLRTSSGSGPSLTGPQVIALATGTSVAAATPQATPLPAAAAEPKRATVHKVKATQ